MLDWQYVLTNIVGRLRVSLYIPLQDTVCRILLGLVMQHNQVDVARLCV